MVNFSWNRLGCWAVLASCGLISIGCDAPPDQSPEAPQSIDGEGIPTEETLPEETWDEGAFDTYPAPPAPEEAAPPLPALDDIPEVTPEPLEATPEFPELPELNDSPELPDTEDALPESVLDSEQEPS